MCGGGWWVGEGDFMGGGVNRIFSPGEGGAKGIFSFTID